MKRLWVALSLVLLSASTAHALDYPEPDGFVTDKAGLLPSPIRESLDAKLTSYQQKTSIEIAVVIIPTLDGMSPHDYADGLWKKWKIGKKGENNGVLLLVVPPPEKQAWIQTGYGVQGWLTDIQCKHIVDDVMKPLNLQEKRPEAVVAGTVAIMSKLGDTPWATRATMTPPKDEAEDVGLSIVAWVLILIVVFFVIMLMIAANSSGGYGSSRGGWSSSGSSSSDSGGGFGGFGGGDSGGGGGGGGSG